eukprot:2302662-Pyramimonas_sp.AAC.1
MKLLACMRARLGTCKGRSEFTIHTIFVNLVPGSIPVFPGAPRQDIILRIRIDHIRSCQPAKKSLSPICCVLLRQMSTQLHVIRRGVLSSMSVPAPCCRDWGLAELEASVAEL